MRVQFFANRGLFLAIAFTAGLAIMGNAPRASMSPAVWVSDRIIGISDGAWIALHVKRHIETAYNYQTSSELRRVRLLNGCIDKKVSLGKTNHIDKDAKGKWLKTQILRGDTSKLAILSSMTPVVPSDWREIVKIENGAVIALNNEKKIILVASQTVLKWADLQGVKTDSVDRVAGVFEAVDSMQGNKWVYLEIETTYRDVDVDYIRFVLPLKISRERSSITDLTELKDIQPSPHGC